MMDTFKDKLGKWKVSSVSPSGENLAVFRKFGHKVLMKMEQCALLKDEEERLYSKGLFMLSVDLVTYFFQHGDRFNISYLVV